MGSKIHQKTVKNINGFAPDSEMDFESILASCWLSFLCIFGSFFEYVNFLIFATPMMRFACFSRSVTSKIKKKTIRKQHRKQNTKLNCIFHEFRLVLGIIWELKATKNHLEFIIYLSYNISSFFRGGPPPLIDGVPCVWALAKHTFSRKRVFSPRRGAKS